MDGQSFEWVFILAKEDRFEGAFKMICICPSGKGKIILLQMLSLQLYSELQFDAFVSISRRAKPQAFQIREEPFR